VYEPNVPGSVLAAADANDRAVLTTRKELTMLNDKSTTRPTELNDAELDAVAAGEALINVSDVNVPVNAAVAATVLGGTAGALATQPSTIFKPGV